MKLPKCGASFIEGFMDSGQIIRNRNNDEVEVRLDIVSAALQATLHMNGPLIQIFEGALNEAVEILHENGYDFDLYARIQNVVNLHFEQVHEQILPYLDTKLDTFIRTLNNAMLGVDSAMTQIQVTFSCLQEYIEVNGLATIKELGFTSFHEKVVSCRRILEYLRDNIMDLFKKQRFTEVLLDMEKATLIHAGLILNSFRNYDLSAYEKYFEDPFVYQSREFYKMESEGRTSYINPLIFSSHILNVTSRICDEQDRLNACSFPKSTISKMVKAAEDELYKKHKSNMKDILKTSGIVDLLDNQNSDGLAFPCRMFSPDRKIHISMRTLGKFVSLCLREKGKELIQEVDKAEGSNPLTFVQNILDLKDQFNHFLNNSFDGSLIFQEMIARDFEHILSENANSVRHIFLFIEHKLKLESEGIISQQNLKVEAETALSKIMSLLKMLTKKDIFPLAYQKHLARRLLYNDSMSDDSKKKIDSDQRTECGHQFQQKLKIMINDLKVSIELTEKFKEHVTLHNLSLNEVDVSVRVLSSMFWPIELAPDAPTGIIPKTLYESFQLFKSFYVDTQHKGRKLTLNPKLGSAELEFRCNHPHKKEKEKHESIKSSLPSLMNSEAGSNFVLQETIIIEVSTYQMLILLLFNDRNSLTYEDIFKETQIPEKGLERALHGLTMGTTSQGILTKSSSAEDIQPSDIFKVNESFSSKLDKVKIETFAFEDEELPNIS